MKSVVKSAKNRRLNRVRKNITGTLFRPRLSVYKSNRYIYAQLIDDVAKKTLVTIDESAIKAHVGKTKVLAARDLGVALAKKALEKNIKKVVFDRGSYRYHGRVKSLADGAREGGLRF
jgi:large subunit ribosomal protein L18